MPQRIQMPDGRWVTLPSYDDYIEQFSTPAYRYRPDFSFLDDDEEDDEEKRKKGTLFGSLLEGVKSIPSGVADVFLSGAQAAVAVATPFVDLPVEKRLRKAASKRARERDPAYQDALMPAVGTGLGQVGALMGISALPQGRILGTGAAIGLGISEQARRIADFEQRTGENVPWYKETAAHALGAAIGFSEIMPIRLPATMQKMMGRIRAGVAPNKWRSAIGVAAGEATQEAAAQFLQATTARGLYDPDALQDITKAMADDFKVGGIVGGLADITRRMIMDSVAKRGPGATDDSIEAGLREATFRRDKGALANEIGALVGTEGMASDVSSIFGESGIDMLENDVAFEITNALTGEWAALPNGIEAFLKSNVNRTDIESLIGEFTARNDAAIAELGKLAAMSKDRGDYGTASKYTKAQEAIGKMSEERLGKLNTLLRKIGDGPGRSGGLTEDTVEGEIYRETKRRIIEDAETSSILDVHNKRTTEKGDPRHGVLSSFANAVRSLMGGRYGIGGFFGLTEILGTRGHFGTEQGVRTAASDQSSFGIDSVGRLVFGQIGKLDAAGKPEAGQINGLRFADEESAVNRLNDLNRDERRAYESNLNLYKKFPFTRLVAEAESGEQFTDEEWEAKRDETQMFMASARADNNVRLAQVGRDKNILYLSLLDNRLKQARDHFLQEGAGNADKRRAARRLRKSVPDFDNWLTGIISTVENSRRKGEEMERVSDAKVVELQAMLENRKDEISWDEREKLEKDIIAGIKETHIQFPRDISAEQLVKISELFIENNERRNSLLTTTFGMRGMADIARWKTLEKLDGMHPDTGLPTDQVTYMEVDRFEKRLKNKPTTDKNRIREEDIEQLLKSKNIFLRNENKIGRQLAGRVLTGVRSRPFVKLLQDLTGAQSWVDASYGQRVFMYSRLLNLPSHDVVRGRYGRKDPLYLPDLYRNQDIDKHVDVISDHLLEEAQAPLPPLGGRPNRTIKWLRQKTKGYLGDNFKSESFNEALARLLETDLVSSTSDQITKEDSDAYFSGDTSWIGARTRETKHEPSLERGPDSLPLDQEKVRFNIFHDQGMEPYISPIKRQEEEIDAYMASVEPEEVYSFLRDPTYTEDIDELHNEYNARKPDEPLSREQYIEQYHSFIMSSLGIDALKNAGVLKTVSQAIATPEGMAQTEDVLQTRSPAGKNVIQAMVTAGILPTSLRGTMHSVKRRYVDTIKTRFDILRKSVDKVLALARIPDNIKVVYVDGLNGMFQFLNEVAVRGDAMPEDVRAVYDSPGNRIIINLSAVDPNNMHSAEQIMRETAFHEGLEALLVRDHLTDEELEILGNYVRNKSNVVPKEVDLQAHEAGLSWFERAIVEFRETNLNEGDIEQEATISLLTNLLQNKVPAAMEGKTRKVKNPIKKFIEGFINAAKDAEISDVMAILHRIERGEVGERGAGFMGDPEYTSENMIRSHRLMRYADPQQVAEMRNAVILRDSAKSDSMRAEQQQKIDDIADKIVSFRTKVQVSAPPAPDLEQAMENIRKSVDINRATDPTGVPLLGKDTSGNPEAYSAALDEFMTRRRANQGYTMPADIRTTLDSQHNVSNLGVEAVKDAVEEGIISLEEGDPKRNIFEKISGALGGGADPRTGDTLEQTDINFKSSVSNLRYNFLDRRQWVVEQTDRLIARQKRAQADAETGAAVMWRNSDNAINWLPALMTDGPLSYLGIGTGSGSFDSSPVYDDQLQETYGGDGRVKGLISIFEPLNGKEDEALATLYGVVKRIGWTESRLNSLYSVTRGIPHADLSPEMQAKLKLFQKSYKDITSGALKKYKNESERNKVIELVEGTPGEPNEQNAFIVEFWDQFHAYDRHHIKMAYDTGLITREQRDEWLGMPWAPFYREVAPEDQNLPVASGQQAARRGTDIMNKPLRESYKPITGELMNSIILNTQALVRDAMMNVSVSRTGRDALELGEATKVSVSRMAADADTRVIYFKENGIEQFYELKDAQLAMSVMMLGLNPKKQLQDMFGGRDIGRLMMKALTSTSTLLRESVTRAPPFAIKNVFRDAWNAMNLTGGGPELLLKAFRNALDPDILRRAREAGLSIGIDFVAEESEYHRTMKREMAKANPDWKKPWTPFKVLWDGMGRLAKQSEVATRVAVYDRVLAMTGDRALAQHIGVEIMNYGRRGANPMLSTYMATVPFMNGRLQGGDVVARGLFEGLGGATSVPGTYGYGLTAQEYKDLPAWKKNRAQILGRGLVLSMATLFYYLMMRDDEEWQDLRDETKSDNWVLPLSDHAWLKIPIPFEIGVLFKVIPEKIAEAITEEDVGVIDVGEEAIRQIRMTTSVGTPQLIAPILGAMRNYDKFRKDTIVDPFMEEGLSANEQRNRFTSNVASSIADFANSIPLVRSADFLTSPMKVEYMVRQYVGTIGAYGVTIADRLARTSVPMLGIEGENIVGTNLDFDWGTLVGGPGIANVPLLGDLLTDPKTRAGRQQDFYELINELDTVVATLASITKRDYEQGFAYREKHRDILRWKNYLNRLNSRMERWRDRKDFMGEVDRSDWSDDEKREYYQSLIDQRTEMLSSMDYIMSEIKHRGRHFR